MGFQCEMPCIEEMEFTVGEIAAEGLCARGTEDFVVLAPGDEQRWLMRAEVLLKRRIAVEVELVVPEQLQLDSVVVLLSTRAGRAPRPSGTTRSSRSAGAG